MEPTENCPPVVTRRNVLVGAGGVAGVALVAACGADDPDTAGDTTSEEPTGGSTGDESPTDGGGGAGPEGRATLTALADVPVGGAVSAKGPDGKPVIVAQPTAGTVVAFSAICTHKGCTVAPEGAEIKCPCHDSLFDLTGKNTGGPAPSPLAPIAVTVSGGNVVAG